MLFTSFSGSLVSRIPGAVQVTDAVMEQVVEWQNRPLDAVYPIVYLDCIVLKVRQDSRVINKSVFLALGINIEGQ
ncbi:transposase, partial [Escherichia coli]